MVVVDTNILSFVFRSDTRALLYRELLEGQMHAIAFVTLGEVYKWPLARNFSAARRDALQKHLRSYVVLPFDDALARRWAAMSVEMQQAGHGISDADGWIAATALRHGLPLVTHNRKHFENVPGLTVVSKS